MLNVPAASAAPVPPAHTSACARPSATARAACTIEASGVARAALTGSAALAIETGASTTSTPARRLAELARAGPNSSTRAPCARRDRGAGRDLGRARGRRRCSRPRRPAARPARRPARRRGLPPHRRYVVVVIVLVVVRARRHDLAARVGAAHRAHPVRPARAVALRARVHRGRADLVLRAALGGAAVRLLFLGDGHRPGRLPARRSAYSSFSSRSFAQRGSGAASWWCSGPASLRSAAHTGHRPGAVLAAEHLRGHRQRERVARPAAQVERLVVDVRALELLAAARAGRPRAPRPRRVGAAGFRQRMHGPLSGALRSAGAARSRRRSCARPRARPARAAGSAA